MPRRILPPVSPPSPFLLLQNYICQLGGRLRRRLLSNSRNFRPVQSGAKVGREGGREEGSDLATQVLF